MNRYTFTRLVIGLGLVALAVYSFIVGSPVEVILGLIAMIYGIIILLTVTNQRERINRIMKQGTNNQSS